MAGAVSGATIRVRGLRELNKAFNQAEKHVRGDLKGELHRVAVPVQLMAQRLAVTKISGLAATNTTSGAEWAHMRIGATQTIVYVAPQQRGRLTKRNKRRYARGMGTGPPSFADLLMTKAMEPALNMNEGETVRRLEDMLDRLAFKNGF